VREDYNWRSAFAAQAARFLYLNRICFNGLLGSTRTGSSTFPTAISTIRSFVIGMSLRR